MLCVPIALVKGVPPRCRSANLALALQCRRPNAHTNTCAHLQVLSTRNVIHPLLHVTREGGWLGGVPDEDVHRSGLYEEDLTHPSDAGGGAEGEGRVSGRGEYLARMCTAVDCTRRT